MLIIHFLKTKGGERELKKKSFIHKKMTRGAKKPKPRLDKLKRYLESEKKELDFFYESLKKRNGK